MTTNRNLAAGDIEPEVVGRVLGDAGKGGAGPLFIIVAGLHGNEPAGLAATQRVLDRIGQRHIAVSGRIVAVAGNLAALARGERYLEADLNRMWTPEHIRRIRETDFSNLNTEEREQAHLIDAIESFVKPHRGKIFIVDLHSTSADAAPFCIISDTLQNRGLAFPLGVPVILGLEESIDGTIQEFYGARGFVTMAVEGGQHGNPATVDRLESALWIALVAAGSVEPNAVTDLHRHETFLRRTTAGLPSVVEVFHRHGLRKDDGFRMRDGFRNFSPVRRGDAVASDRDGVIRVEENGMLVLPSYQRVGDDGFFLGRRVRRFWLRLSTIVRKIGLDRVLRFLPGVRRDSSDTAALLADPRVTRWLLLEIFHLAGFRKCKQKNGFHVFRRRPEASTRDSRV